MAPAVVICNFPRGALPAAGFRCEACGEEVLAMEEVSRLQGEAERLGLYGLHQASRRKLLRVGNSVSVSLDRDLLREALGDVGPGDWVRVGREGKRIVIEGA